MSSRDDSNRPRLRDEHQSDTTDRRPPRSRFSDVDPADIDRYLSGRPSKSQEDAARPQPRPTSTARQLEHLQQQVSGGSRTRRTPADPVDTTDAGETTTPRPSAASLAARSTFRTNRRASYMREDPYVDADGDDADTAEAAPIRRPARRATAPAYDQPLEDPERESWDDERSWDEEPAYRETPVPRTRPQRPPMQRPTFTRPTMPRAIAGADVVNDVPALVFIAIATLGLAAMAILVANRLSTLDDVIPTHVSASGVFDRFASRETVWQIPLLATVLTLMNIVAAWFISPLDRFASRFLLATGVVVQFVAWVALLRILY